MKNLKKILFIITPKNYKKSVFLLILILIGTFLETFGIAIIIPIIKLITDGKEYFLSLDYVQNNSFILENLQKYSSEQILIFVVAAIFAFFTFKAFFLVKLTWDQNKFSGNLMSEVSQRLFKIYMYSPYSFHLQKNSSQLIHNIISETNLLSSTVILAILTLITEFLVLISIFILLLVIETRAVLIITFILFLICFIYYETTKKMLTNWGYLRQNHDSLRLKHLQQGLGGIKDIKLLGRENEFIREFSTHAEKLKITGIKTNFILLIPRIGLEYLGVLSVSIILLLAIMNGSEKNAIISSLAVFTAAAFRLMPSVNRILSALQNLRSGLPVIERLYNEFKNKHTEENLNKIDSKNIFNNSLEFKHVSFSYEGSKQILHEISFKIKKGETIGIIGESGSGKTTLVDLMLGLLDPKEGKIEVDGTSIKFFKRTWQSKIGYVPQFIYLSDDTLAKNIAFGINDKDINLNRVEECVKAANLNNFIENLPNKLNSFVGERGARLSGGQLQRIGIARSLYHKPEVLILDEATSSLDIETEKRIIEEVNNVKKFKTIIFISHRLSAIKDCDFIIQLDKGKIVNFGKPKEILNKQ